MRLVDIGRFYNLEIDIFGEKPKQITVYVIAYKNDRGEENEYRTENFYEMITFIKRLYEREGFQDILEDPRDDDFFQEYMRGNLVDLR